MRYISNQRFLVLKLRLLAIIIFSFMVLISNSQDVIYLKNKKEIQAKVFEINDERIMYRKYEQPEDSIFQISKEDVVLIIYQNGTREVFVEESKLITDTDKETLEDNTPATIVFLPYSISRKIEYFHNNKYIGKTRGAWKHLKYECSPGEQLLWASYTNKEFLTTNLKPGGTYFVLVSWIGGVTAWDSKIKLVPINESYLWEKKRIRRLLKIWREMNNPPDKIEESNIQLKEFIAEKLMQYETDWKYTHDFKHISPDMAITDPAFLSFFK